MAVTKEMLVVRKLSLNNLFGHSDRVYISGSHYMDNEGRREKRRIVRRRKEKER